MGAVGWVHGSPGLYNVVLCCIFIVDSLDLKINERQTKEMLKYSLHITFTNDSIFLSNCARLVFSKRENGAMTDLILITDPVSGTRTDP